MVEEAVMNEKSLKELFTKFSYMQLEQIINIMKYDTNTFNNEILIGYCVLKEKNPSPYDKDTELDVLNYKELLFLYDVVASVEDRLSSVREIIDYDIELKSLSEMELDLYNKLNSKREKRLILEA